MRSEIAAFWVNSGLERYENEYGVDLSYKDLILINLSAIRFLDLSVAKDEEILFRSERADIHTEGPFFAGIKKVDMRFENPAFFEGMPWARGISEVLGVDLANMADFRSIDCTLFFEEDYFDIQKFRAESEDLKVDIQAQIKGRGVLAFVKIMISDMIIDKFPEMVRDNLFKSNELGLKELNVKIEGDAGKPSVSIISDYFRLNINRD
jgi:hypothetical protein